MLIYIDIVPVQVPSVSWYPLAQAWQLSGPAPVQPAHTLLQAVKDKHTNSFLLDGYQQLIF